MEEYNKIMNVTKCDMCKKEIDHKEGVGVSFANYNYKNLDLCEDCATPILKFLKKNKIFKGETRIIKKS